MRRWKHKKNFSSLCFLVLCETKLEKCFIAYKKQGYLYFNPVLKNSTSGLQTLDDKK
jgi:hypothetical protein